MAEKPVVVADEVRTAGSLLYVTYGGINQEQYSGGYSHPRRGALMSIEITSILSDSYTSMDAIQVLSTRITFKNAALQ
jgi:hypothetical protein